MQTRIFISRLLFTILGAISLPVFPSIALAQKAPADGATDDKTPPLSRFGFHLGNLLPDQIEGITEILPMAGIRYGFPRKKSLIELGAMSAQSLGVNYYNVSASIRADVPMEGIIGIFFAGVDGHYYKAPTYDAYRTALGAHIGGGIAAPISEYLNFRGEMKFNLHPGISLYIGFGFEMLFPSDEGGDKK